MYVGEVALDELEEDGAEFTEGNMLAVLEKLEMDTSLNDTMRNAASRLKEATRDVFKIGRLFFLFRPK